MRKRFHPWTDADLALLADGYRKVPTQQLAERIGVTPQAVIHRARKLGLNHRIHVWTARDRNVVRRKFGRVLTSEIAAEIGVSVRAVLAQATSLGLSGRFDFYTHQLRKVEAHYAAESSSLADLLASYGLPADLRVREFQILMALVDGPATRPQLAERLGMPVHRHSRQMFKSNDRGGSYTGRLIARGLIARLVRYKGAGNGAGRLPNVYMLTLTAAETLAGAKRQGGGR